MHAGKEAHIAEDYFCGLQHAFWTGLKLAAIQFSMESKQRPFFSYQTKIKKNRNFLMLKKQLLSHSFGLQMDGKTINTRQEALLRLPNSWLLGLSQRARDEKSSSRHTRKARKRACLASFSCLFYL